MAEPPFFVTAPAHVRSIDFGHVLVLVDYRTGRVHCLLPAAAMSWREAARTSRAHCFPAPLAERLLATGLLTCTPVPTPWNALAKASTSGASWGSTEHPAGVKRPQRTTLPITLGALAALAVVSTAKYAGNSATAMHRITRLVLSAVSTCRQSATLGQATDAVLAVRRAGWHCPGRTACLEESAAAVLLLAARRLAVTWCHGVAADPVRLHAWVQTVDGSRVAEPPSTRAYSPVLTIGANHQHQS